MLKLLCNVVQFNVKYCVLSLGLLAVLVLIAAFVHDQFVRPFLGDALVVVWLYVLLRTFIKIEHVTAAFVVLVFSCSVEIAQYFKLVNVLGLQDIKLARIIIGSTFDWMDFVAYATGWLIIMMVAKGRLRWASRRLS